MIYFIQSAGGGPIKIGTTKRLAPRLSILRWETKDDLVVLGILDGGLQEEKRLHRLFGHLRVKGEWFDPDMALQAFIDKHGREWKPSDDAPKPVPGETPFERWRREPAKASSVARRKRTKYVHVPCSEEWHKWLGEQAKARDLDMAEFLAKAADFYAFELGLPKSPDR